MDVKISSKGWLVITADLRRKYSLDTGTRVTVVDYGGVLSLVPTTDDAIWKTKPVRVRGLVPMISPERSAETHAQ